MEETRKTTLEMAQEKDAQAKTKCTSAEVVEQFFF
jgi:hypothetical protein